VATEPWAVWFWSPVRLFAGAPVAAVLAAGMPVAGMPVAGMPVAGAPAAGARSAELVGASPPG
jgi:hypothetical protein